MSNFADALGKSFTQNKDQIRIRTFELGGHIFKVKVPLTVELEAMQERLKEPDEAIIDGYYKDLAGQFLDNKEESEKVGVVFKENDVIVSDRSLREAAVNKAMAQMRITEMFKLLVPEDKDFDMANITYPMIEELFPFSVQLEVMEAIGKAISPEYKAQRGK